MPPRRSRRPKVLLLLAAAVVLAVWLTDWPSWAVVVGGMTLAVGTLASRPSGLGQSQKGIVGQLPALAPAFQARTDLRAEMARERENGNDIVLHGTGGTGTTQLAAAVAHEAVRVGAAVVVWVDAGAPASVVTSFALAAHHVEAPGTTGTDVSVDAHAFVAWMEETDRRWLVVFDGITDIASLDEWWPEHPSTGGWVVGTTTRSFVDPQRTRIEVGPFTEEEALGYLTDRRLADEFSIALVSELEHQPLALYRATSYLRAERLTGADYLQRWIDRRKTVVDPAEAAVLLAADAAQQHRPVGRALSALRLASVLDPAGQPTLVWTNIAVTGFVAGDEPATNVSGVRALDALHRYGLVDFDRRIGAWAVRMHPDTAHAVRRSMPASVRDTAARAAADAVLSVWPDDDAYPQYATHVQVLRANAVFLARLDGDPLWRPEPHELLWRAGISLERGGLFTAAIAYWQHLVDTAERVVGADHRNTLTALGRLAASQRDAERTAESLASFERVVEGLAKLVGPHHPDTLDATESLAIAYLKDGRHDESVDTAKRLVADRVKLRGQQHEESVKARFVLATCYRHAGRPAAAAAQFELVLEGYREQYGPEHPETLDMKRILADVRREEKEERSERKQRVDEETRTRGPKDPETLLARGRVAVAQYDSGDTGAAIRTMKTVVDDMVEVLGPRHADTLTATSALAGLCQRAGRTGEAVTYAERVVAGRTASLGPRHPDTIEARLGLADLYQDTGRPGEAVGLLEQVLRDRAEDLGPQHADTVLTRANLAHAYAEAGRTDEAKATGRQAVAELDAKYGELHPLTVTAQTNLAEVCWRAGDTDEAVALLEHVLMVRKATLDPDHPDTTATAERLAEWTRNR